MTGLVIFIGLFGIGVAIAYVETQLKQTNRILEEILIALQERNQNENSR